MSAHLPQVISRSSILSGCQGQYDTKWFDLAQCFEEHLEEALEKLPYLEDDIWGKLVLMERNQRVAKAYLRQSVITVNGSDRDFDGVTLGIKSFSRFSHSEKNQDGKIGAGIRLKIELQGDILTKRFSSHPVDAYCPTIAGRDADTRSDFSKVRLPDASRAVKVFDMRKFKVNLEEEFRRSDGDFRRLLLRSVFAFCLVKETGHLLNSPCWFFVINMISLDMIRMRLQALGLNSSILRDRPLTVTTTAVPHSSSTLGRHATSLSDMTMAMDSASFDSGTWRTTSSALHDPSRSTWHCDSPDVASQTGSLLAGSSSDGGYHSLLRPNGLLKCRNGNSPRYSPSLTSSQPSESSDSVASSTSSSLKRSSGSLNDLRLRMTTPDDDESPICRPALNDVELLNESNWLHAASYDVDKTMLACEPKMEKRMLLKKMLQRTMLVPKASNTKSHVGGREKPEIRLNAKDHLKKRASSSRPVHADSPLEEHAGTPRKQLWIGGGRTRPDS